MENNEIVKKLSEIRFYKQFPSMIPFVGENYLSLEHKKLLLIGESYYLPNETTLHHSPDNWYKSEQDELDNYEIEWINCTGLLKCDWDSAGHFIYREINSCIKSLNIKMNKRPIDEIAYTNYFQRPSEKEGESFKNFCNEKDISVSKEIVESVVEILNPDMIVFVSKYSWDIGGQKLCESFKNRKIDFVCHPGTGGRYWHNKTYPHNKNKFIKLLKESFIINDE